MIVKANKTHAKKKYYIKQKSDVSLSFGISHYAGIVNYSTEGNNFIILKINCTILCVLFFTTSASLKYVIFKQFLCLIMIQHGMTIINV